MLVEHLTVAVTEFGAKPTRKITMSFREFTPLRVVGVFLVAAALAGGIGNARGSENTRAESSAIKRFNQRTLHTVNGVTIHELFDPKSRTVSASAHGRPLIDGAYKMVSGGSIRVKGGIIVWDSLGVIARLTSGDDQALGTLPA